MRTAARFKNLIATIATILLVVFSSVSGGAVKARAAVSESPVEAYEAQNVWDDLQGTKIDGKGIDLSLYNFDESKNAQVLSFVEFCYAFSKDKQSDYGLYVYVYNPRGYDWTKNEQLNKIQIRYTGKSTSNFDKYPLKYLNRSTEESYEGLFYKFKVDLSEEQRTTILGALNSSERVYEVGEIELYHTGTNATAYDVANTFTYTGFAKGYGSDSATDDTLKCTGGSLMTLTLDVHPTYYRPEGTNGKDSYTQDSLHSVYFSIPNEILNEYGGLSAVHANWLNALTAPMFVTGNKAVYDALFRYVGQNVGYYNTDVGYALYGGCDNYIAFDGLKTAVFAYNAQFKALAGKYSYDRVLDNLNGIFYAGNRNADNYTVSSEEILEWLQVFTKEYSNVGTESGESSSGGGLIIGGGSSGGGGGGGGSRPASNDLGRSIADSPNSSIDNVFNSNTGGGGSSSSSSNSSTELVLGKYSAKLFDSVDKEFTDVNIQATDKYSLTSEKIGQTWWEKLWGSSHIESSVTFNDIQAIHPVTSDDFKSDTSLTCKALYIAESDYSKFKAYYDAATKQDKTVFLFRYQASDYKAWETTECQYAKSLGVFIEKKIDTNSFIFQETVNLDFDIIDVTCTKGNVSTVIACVMSPIEIVNPGTPPIYTTPDKPVKSDFWKFALTASVILIVLFIGVRVVKSIRKKGA